MGHHAGTPKGYSPHRSSNHIHVGDSHGLILNNADSAHCSHCRFSHHLQLYGFHGGFDGRCGWWISPQIGHNSLEAGRWGNLWFGLGGPWWWHWLGLHLSGPPTFFGPLTLGPPSPCTLAVQLMSQLARSWEGLPHRCHQLGRMQHLCPTRELAQSTLSLNIPLTLYQRGGGTLLVWCLQPLAQPVPSWALW